MAYNNFKNIQMVVEFLKQHNIRQLVISPGGTNVPLVKLVQNDPFFTCYSIPDERSAMYFAIGLYLQTKSYAIMLRPCPRFIVAIGHLIIIVLKLVMWSICMCVI